MRKFCVVSFALVVMFVRTIIGFVIAGASSSYLPKKIVTGDMEGLVDRLSNPGFEESGGSTGVLDWNYFQVGFEINTDEYHSGSRSLRCVSADAETQYGVYQVISLNQQDALPLVIGGWSKAENVAGSIGSGYSVYVDAYYNDGEPLWGQIAPFSVGTHDWEYQEQLIIPEKPIATGRFSSQ